MALILALGAAAVALIHHSSTTPDWDDRHRLALASGPLLAYALLCFHQSPMIPAPAA